jgi:hypothetical protein
MGASGRTYLHPEPHREHVPVTRRAATAAVWVLIGLICISFWTVVGALLAWWAGVDR